MNKGNCELSTQSQSIYAAFAASHSHISAKSIELVSSMSRYVLFSDIAYALKTKHKHQSYKWMGLKSISSSTPSSSVIETWVLDLAIKQIMISRHALRYQQPLYIQTDGGHQGQEVRLMSYYDPPSDNIKKNWMGLTYCGKTSDEVAKGIKLSLDLCVGTGRKMNGSTVDSGGGTPESFG